MRLKLHKWTHWEYWPVQVVYALTFLYWCISAIRFGRIHFYRWANPGIENGGLYGDSKWKIYKMLPTGTYPKTVLINRDEALELSDILDQCNFQFPLIVKPDVGCRGVMVQKVFSLADIENYCSLVKEDFLVQEVCDFPNELGLFYHRHPFSGTGEISGITVKKFLSVVGNGHETIEQLMQKEFRSSFQIEKLRAKVNLNEVLAKDEVRELVPFGNHNRGTLFLDGQAHITPKLVQTFDRLLRDIPGFNYGRLDIRFNTWEELENGINFSIIELNGAKSEPTHIYDPKHSFFFGQKEIFRHQKAMMNIVSANLKMAHKNGTDFNSGKSPLLNRN